MNRLPRQKARGSRLKGERHGRLPRLEKMLAAVLLLGVLFLSLHFLFPAIDFSMQLIVIAIAGFLFFPTYALKLWGKAETYYIVSLLKTRRFTRFIERISRLPGWDRAADLGLVLGFGVLAVDWLWGRQRSRKSRLVLDIASALILFGLFFLVFGRLFVAADTGMLLLLIMFSISFALGGLMLFAIISLVWQASDIVLKILAGKTPCPGVAPIIPGVQMPNVPPALTPPVYIWIVFLIILAVHEFSHGALMKRTRARIKSIGLLLAGLLPIGAFVEPDEKEIKKKSDRQQLRVYAIGPAANVYSIAVFLAIFLVAAAAAGPFLSPQIESMERGIGIESIAVSGVVEEYFLCGEAIESPAYGIVEEGWILRQYNGVEPKTLHDFRQALAKPGEVVPIVFETGQGLVEKQIEKNRYGQIGIKTMIHYVQGKEPTQEYLNLMLALSTLLTFFSWLLLISFALAVVNFLPIEPFDGGKIGKIIFLPYFAFLKMGKKDTEKFIGRLFLWVVVGLLAINALPLLL